jgi:hypothetical protein
LRQGAVLLLGETAMVRVRVTRTDRDQRAGCLKPGAGGHLSVRVTTAFNRLLRVDDLNVTAVEWFTTLVVVTVVLRRRRP